MKAVDVVSNGEAANNEPEKAIVTVDTTKNGQKAPKGSFVKVYKAGELNTPIGEGVVGDNGQVVITITEKAKDPSSKAPENITSTDKLVATVQEVGTDGTTPVKAPSIPSTAVQVGTPAIGKHDANNPQSGGHEGDETAPTTAPTLEALTDDTNLGAVKVKLPEDAKDGDRVIVTFTPETPENAQQVSVTLTKGANGWTSDKPELIANPVNGNEVTIAKDKVKDNTEVTAVIKDLADNEKAASPNARAYPNERTPLENGVAIAKAIDTDDVSNATPEKFTIKGTAEKDATVTATITLPSGEKVVIGTFKVTEENGSFSFDTTDIKKDETLKAKLTNFTFNTENGQATQITVEATKEGKAPSHAQTVNAKAAAKGVKEDHTETTAPDNPTITPYMEGFGGAKITLPTPQSGELLEVKVTVTPKAENGQDTQPAKEVTLTYNGTTWSLPNNDSSNLGLTLKKDGDKNVVILSGDKVPYGGTIAATTTDFAGNKPEAVTQNLNKGPTDETAKEPDYSKDRTDVPTIKAGRTEGTGTNSDQPNAGDIVAKPGGDNDRMVVKYVDDQGQPKEIAVKKDLEQGKWVLDDTTPADKKPASTDDYIIKDDGTVIVKGSKVKDGSEAEAVGYKTVGSESVASNKPYETSDTTENNTRLTTVQEAKIKALVDDTTPKEADAPHLVKGKDNTYQQGTAIIEPQGDNEKVVVSFKGYTMTPTAMPGETTSNNQPIPTVKPQNGTSSVSEDVDMVLVAQKVNGVWELFAATKADYEKLQQAQTTPTDNGENPSNTQGVGLVSAKDAGIATIDPNTGKITLNANAVKDGSSVTAKGYNALGLPTEGKDAVEKTQGVNGQPDQVTSNTSITVGSDLRQDQDVVADKPSLEQLSNGDMVARPQGDNTKLEVAFEKKGSNNNEKTTVTIEQGEKDISFASEDGQTQTAKVKVWKFSENQQNLTEDNDGDPNTMLINGVKVKLSPETGELTLDKSGLKENSNITAVGIEAKSNRSEPPAEQQVKADPTPTADPATVTPDGTIIPGGDTKEYEIFKKPLEGEGEAQSIGKVVKGEDGQWTDQGLPNGMAVDPNTGKVTVPAEQVGENNGIYVETKDGNGAISGSGEPVKPPKTDTTPDATDKPTITQGTDENVGGLIIKPGQTTTPADTDNVRLEVSYVKEKAENGEDKPTTDASTQTADGKLVTTKNTQTGKWSFEKLTREVEQDGADGQKVKVTEQYDVPSTVAEINPETGEITLKAFEVMDNTQVNVTAYNNKNVPAKADPATAAANPGTVAEADQPKGPEIITVEPPPPSPPDDSQTSADQLDTPTLFQNTNTGEVKVTPGTNVDFISFTAAIGGQTQNFAFIKDEQGWEKYVMKITGDQVDKDGNGVLSGNETIEYKPADSNIGNPPFTIRNITSDKLTNITVGRAGDEYLTVTQDQAVQDNMDIGGKGAHTVHEFKVKKADSTEAVPEKMHVLSNGEELVAPIIQAQHDSTAQKYRVKVIADPTKLSAIQFNIDANGNDNVFSLKSNGTNWSYYNYWTDNGNYNDGPNKTLVKQGEANNIIYIEDVGSNKTFHINNDLETSNKENLVYEIFYGAKAKVDGKRMDDFYGSKLTYEVIADNSTAGAITLTDVNMRQNPQAFTGPVQSAGGSGGTNTGGDSGGTQTGGGTAQPQPTPPAQPPEQVDAPTAQVDSARQGGIKVKPADTNSGAKYRVDYVDEATGQSRVINVKKTGRTWAFEQEGSTGSIDNQKIQLNANTGELTFAPEAVRDGGKVIITAYDSQGNARAQKDVVAADEPITVKLIRDTASENIGGAKATPATGTNKFKLTFTDEGNNINVSKPTAHNVVYEKVNGSWKVVEVDGQKSSTITINGVSVDLNTSNAYLTVNSSTGEVTIDRNSLEDSSPVSMIPYSKHGTESSGNAKTITTEKDKLVTALDDSSQNLSQLRGTDHRWGEVAIKGNGGYIDGLAQLVHGKRHDKSDTNNAKATVTPLTQEEDKATVSNGKGKRLSYSDNNDVVKIGEKVMNKWTWDPTLKFDFKNGDDILAVGHDLGYGDWGYSGLKSEYEHWQKVADRYRVQVDMGAGNDILAVGFHDTDWDVIKDRNTGVIDIHKRSQGIHGYEKVEFLNSNEWYGGQLAGAKVFMGDGNDTVILKGTPIDRNGQRASKNSIIDLGEGDNRLVLTPGETIGRAMSSTKVVAGNGNDVVKGDSFIENTDIRLGGGSDEFIARKVKYTLVDLGHGDDWAEVKGDIGNGAQILLGAGNDVFSMKAGLSPNNSRVDGGSGVDTLLIEKNGAHITNHKIKGFENVLFTANNTTLGIRADYFGSIEGPMKVSKLSNVTGAKVDLGMNGDMRSNAQDSQPDDRADGSYRWTHKSTAAEGDKTYDVYEYVVAPKHQVWIEQGIIVL
ncbi:hypothetical protein Q7370_06630 [Glaesserella parasuis]|nr:hypothetical protein [Glaesserella parasuis]MDP0072758.1 hypothetical protein [Glaesserella parasuis]MDP0109436.1 hypothetical protein [Glaesserella parasuis]MDP0211677.1 hypothetical protein [Glaesserella parasuis]